MADLTLSFVAPMALYSVGEQVKQGEGGQRRTTTTVMAWMCRSSSGALRSGSFVAGACVVYIHVGSGFASRCEIVYVGASALCCGWCGMREVRTASAHVQCGMWHCGSVELLT